MTVGELALVTLALFVIAGGAVWLHAWWQARRGPPSDRPKNGEWPT